MPEYKTQFTTDEQADLQSIRDSELKFQLLQVGIQPDLENVLGNGSFSFVFPAIDRGNKMRALKISRHFNVQTQTEFQRGQEIWPLTACHQSLLTNFWGDVIECKQAKKKYVCTMWEIATTNLREFAELNETTAAKVLGDVARALDHLHFVQPSGVAHRDIKPANIMIESSNGIVVGFLADLGCARIADDRAGTQNVGNAEYRHQLQFDGDLAKFRQCDNYSFALVCLDTLWRIKNPQTKRDHFYSMHNDQKRKFAVDLLQDAEKADWLCKLICSDDLNFDIPAVEIVNKLFADYADTAVHVQRSPFEVIDVETLDSVQLDLGLLDTLGLTDKVLRRITAESIGAKERNLPRLLDGRTSAFGAIRAKQLAFELLKFRDLSKSASVNLKRLVSRPGPADTVRIPRLELAEITWIRYSLEKIAVANGYGWSQYLEKVNLLFEPVDEAWAALEKIQFKDRPLNLDDAERRFEDGKLDEEEQRRFFQLVAEKIIEAMNEIGEEIEDFYGQHCMLLNDRRED